MPQDTCELEVYGYNQNNRHHHMAFERVFGIYELGEQIFSFLSAKDLLRAQQACTTFHPHVQAVKKRFTRSGPMNRGG